MLAPSLTDGDRVSRQRLGRSLLLATAVAVTVGGCAASVQGGASSPSSAEIPLTPGRHDYSGIKSAVYNGQVMAPDAALDAIGRNAGAVLDQTPPASSSIAGTARIVVPDHDRLRLLAAQRIKAPTVGAVNLLAEETRIDLRLTADAVARSRVFPSVTIVEQNDTAAPGFDGADYLLWYEVRSLAPNNAGPWNGRWLLKRSGAASADAVTADPGTPGGTPRLASFVRSIQAVAAHPGVSLASGGDGAPRPVSGGSGMVVDAQGHILTNNHVIANCPTLRVTDTDGAMSTALLLAGDAANDLALLKTERRWPAWARFHGSHGLRPGEPIVVTGFPLTGLVSPEMAVTTGSLTAMAGVGGDTRQLEFSAPVQPGNSGGPVLDDSGRVVGVASSVLNSLALAALTGAMAQNVNFAIKADVAKEFLDANRVALDEGAGRQGMSAAAVGDLARKFTVKVECLR